MKNNKEAKTPEYVIFNVNEDNYRNWDDCMNYGFLSAGEKKRRITDIQKLEKGCRVYAYIGRKDRGYVGYGEITKEAVMAKDFVVESNGIKLLDLPLKADIKKYADDPDMSEYVIGVKWIAKVQKEDGLYLGESYDFPGKRKPGRIWEELKDTKTLEKLQMKFEE